jgi:pimeloyl-ACP methyl ester carboxylesterase
VAGISLGAHALAFALSSGSTAFSAALLVMPAWTGPPGHTASLTELAARGLQTRTPATELQRLIDLATPDQDWIVSALRSSWVSQPKERLVAGMTQAAVTPGPTISDLSTIATPTVIVGLRDDPLHPVDTARSWQDVIPNARYVELTSTQINESGNFATPEVLQAWEAMAQTSG